METKKLNGWMDKSVVTSCRSFILNLVQATGSGNLKKWGRVGLIHKGVVGEIAVLAYYS